MSDTLTSYSSSLPKSPVIAVEEDKELELASLGSISPLDDDWLVLGSADLPSPTKCFDQNKKPQFFPVRVVSKIKQTVQEMSLRQPLNKSDWKKYLDDHGCLVDETAMRIKVFFGGVHPEMRCIIWRHLLGAFPHHLSARRRMQAVLDFHAKYAKLKSAWQKGKHDKIKYLRDAVLKDVLRTDRRQNYFNVDDDHPHVTKLYNVLMTYAYHHSDVSYAQGMSDLASPFVVLYEDEADSYMGFSQMMKRMRFVFHLDSESVALKFRHLRAILEQVDPDYWDYLVSADAGDMLFCYRWLLLDLKREFPFTEAIRVMEAIWSVLPVLPTDITDDADVTEMKSETTDPRSSEEGKKDIVNELNSIRPSTAFPLDEEEMEDLTDAKQHGSEPRKSVASTSFSFNSFNFGDPEISNPETCGDGNPFALFVCIALLSVHKSHVTEKRLDGNELAMHYDRSSKKNDASKVLSRARSMFIEYLNQSGKASKYPLFVAIRNSVN